MTTACAQPDLGMFAAGSAEQGPPYKGGPRSLSMSDSRFSGFWGLFVTCLLVYDYTTFHDAGAV